MLYSMSDVNKSAGSQHFNWNGTNSSGAHVEPGVYYVKISTAYASSMEKLMLVK